VAASATSATTELSLDPPDASGPEAGQPLLDEDYLILSTIHSAKGQEWDSVFILNLGHGHNNLNDAPYPFKAGRAPLI
jgi:DNA helicase-2/ATP-dependent DNA helicase PcrA